MAHVAPAALARKLGLPQAEVERADFVERVLLLRGSVYWTSDRFRERQDGWWRRSGRWTRRNSSPALADD